MNIIFNGECVDYEYVNNNKPDTILFLHGWGGNKFSFAGSFKLLNSKFNLLSVTMPTTEKTVKVWTLFDYYKLIETILKLHNVFNPIIVSHSFGFRVACLINQFIKIKKIVVTGGAGLKKLSIFRKIDKQNNLVLLKNKKYGWLYKKIASVDYKNLSTTNKKTFKNIINKNLIKCCKFSCPMLLFWGINDKDTPIWIAKKLKKINHCTLIKTKSDHFAYLKENALFNKCLMEFLK